MVKRWYIEIGRSNPVVSENGDWVRYEDYAKLKESHQRLLDVCQDLNALISGSSGVAGWHLNGDIADWDEFEPAAELEAAIAEYEAMK